MQTTTRAQQAIRRARRAARRVRRPPDPGSAQRSPATPSRRPRSAPRTAILVVNGFDRRGRWGQFNEDEAREFPWIDLCVQQIERHSRGASYEILVWDNTAVPEHQRLLRAHPRVRMFTPHDPARDLPHGASLDRLVSKVRSGTEFLVTLDTDSFPIRDGWIQNLTGRLSGDVPLAGVWRDELLPRKPAFVHPSCLAIRAETLQQLGTGFTISDGADVAHNVTRAVEDAGGRISKLRRSNVWKPHFLMGAVYGDLIYHQGAGSRAPMFSKASDAERAETVRLTLRDTAFSRLDDLVDVLTGNADPRSVPALAALTAPTPVAGDAAQE